MVAGHPSSLSTTAAVNKSQEAVEVLPARTSRASATTIRLGLIRHFPVQQPFPAGWRTAGELGQWLASYDASPVEPCPADLDGADWSLCVSSDLPRAVTTARALFPGPVETTPLLREVGYAPFRTGYLRLPVFIWRWLLHLAWLTGHKSQRDCRDEFRARVRAAADLLERRSGAILVVSHAGMMMYLSEELRSRGFSGPRLRMPRHATLFSYSKEVTRG